MELEELRVFLAVARNESFSGAARELHLSQPSVSERMAKLERRIGRPLVVRSNRGVRLTSAGERLVGGADRSIEAVRLAHEAARIEDTEHQLHITAYASYASQTSAFVLQTLDGYNCALSFDDQHSTEAVRRVAHGTTDVAFTLAVPHPSDVVFHLFGVEPVVVVCAPQHPLARADGIDLTTLGTHQVAFNNWGSGASEFRAALGQLLNPIRRLIDTAPAGSVRALALTGLAVGVLARSTVEQDLDDKRLVELAVADFPSWDVEVYFSHRKERGVEPMIARLCQAVTDQQA